ncbi:MAG: hypothetical protein KGL02_11795 [Acidobacteriota bacterium]|nr:hypothetical protein [Acidobacteriota bacterium]MDE3171422.1 hypothetical protein [Acidobacteriota bacterium]
MKTFVPRVIDLLFMLMLSMLLVIPQDVFAQNHVISSANLQRDVAAASALRRQHVSQAETLFALPQARHALQSAHIDYRQVTDAIPQLNDKELARLAQLSQKSQKDFAAGTLTNHDLLVILVAVAALILIIVAVKH